MKSSASKEKIAEAPVLPPNRQTPRGEPKCEQIRRRAQAIYFARGGMTRMTLNEWLMTEMELKQELEQQVNHQPTGAEL